MKEREERYVGDGTWSRVLSHQNESRNKKFVDKKVCMHVPIGINTDNSDCGGQDG